eukprot:GILJ01008226.1.p1 GENE.GILJ01008226.1~~GILJ01008226.1.p1  ORF type:complete len:322 (-),score=31.01 GILJ01008226.1:219-1184(-)
MFGLVRSLFRLSRGDVIAFSRKTSQLGVVANCNDLPTLPSEIPYDASLVPLVACREFERDSFVIISLSGKVAYFSYESSEEHAQLVQTSIWSFPPDFVADHPIQDVVSSSKWLFVSSIHVGSCSLFSHADHNMLCTITIADFASMAVSSDDRLMAFAGHTEMWSSYGYLSVDPSGNLSSITKVRGSRAHRSETDHIPPAFDPAGHAVSFVVQDADDNSVSLWSANLHDRSAKATVLRVFEEAETVYDIKALCHSTRGILLVLSNQIYRITIDGHVTQITLPPSLHTESAFSCAVVDTYTDGEMVLIGHADGKVSQFDLTNL